jgi:hypothetical protein
VTWTGALRRFFTRWVVTLYGGRRPLMNADIVTTLQVHPVVEEAMYCSSWNSDWQRHFRNYWYFVLETESLFRVLLSYKPFLFCEISSSHGGEYDVQSCLLGYTAV